MSSDVDGLNKDLANARNKHQEHLRTLKNGAVYDTQKGQIVANPGGGTAAFTPETSRHAHLARKGQNIRSDRLGAILGTGIEIDPDATDEEVALKYGNARTAYVAHLGKLTLKATTLRDVPASVARLLELDGRSGEDGGGPLSMSERQELNRLREFKQSMHELSAMARRIDQEEAEKRQAVEGRVINV